MDDADDIRILRNLAKRYLDCASDPVYDERRGLWRRHNSLKKTRTPVLATYGMWNVWCRQVFSEDTLECRDPFFRAHELSLRLSLFHHTVGDDYILEPWIAQHASLTRGWRSGWGVQEASTPLPMEGGAWAYDPPVKEWSDMEKLSPPPHRIDEKATARNVSRLRDAVGDILPVSVSRAPLCQGFMADISTCLAGLRGLERMMIDMRESPEELHWLLAFMRDGILANNRAAEEAGDYSLADHSNQAMPYAEELEPPCPNSGPRQRKDLWGFCAAQEFTLVSPAMHDEFLLRYQIPIYRHYGLTAYGCCEDLSRKIGILRKLPNLRIIAVAPRADVHLSAEQIGADYVASWRPNPTDMMCSEWNESRIRRILREGMEAFRGCRMHLHLKDIETVQGEPDRLARWVRIVRETAEAVA